LAQNHNIHKEGNEIVRFSMLNYFGVLIGIFSNLFIYTTNEEFLGILRYFESLAYFICLIILMGVSSSLIKFSPKLKENSNIKLFSYSLLTIFRNAIIVFLVLFLGVDLFSNYLKFEFIYFSFFLAFIFAGIDLIKKQLTIYKKIAFPSVLDNLLPKLVLPSIFILLYFSFLQSNVSGISLYIISYLFIVIILTFFAFKRHAFGFTFDYKSIFKNFSKREYFEYSLFALAGSLGYLFVFKLDTLMIPNLISYKANGIYSIAVVAASVIYIPARGLFSLYGPKVSSMIAEKQFEALNKSYKAISKTLLFLGLLIYSCIFLGIEMLFQLLPSKDLLSETISVIFIIGATSVFNMATSFNSEIINYSRFYRFNIMALLVLTLFNLAANYFFIVFLNMGIEGAALASLLSIIIYNISKLVFIYFRLNLFPFDLTFFKLLLLQLFLMLLFYLSPDLTNHVLNFIFKVGGVLFCQLFLIYKLNWVPIYTKYFERFFYKLRLK